MMGNWRRQGGGEVSLANVMPAAQNSNEIRRINIGPSATVFVQTVQ
jgi:hypothetical protein